jgi:predicted phage baseplate assembly protein
VRQDAPVAFRTLERAVTSDDYATLAGRHPDVQRAQATMRWTGSWRTVFLTVDRVGARPVDAAFEGSLRAHLERYRMAGHDIEIDGPRFVALEVALFVCVERGYFRSDVETALRDVLGSRSSSGGRRGAFHPDNFTFGQPVYLSPLLAAAQAVTGVSWAEFRTFQRLGIPSRTALDEGALHIGRLEIARLDNDPSFPERGVLRLELEGGR